MKEQKLNKGDNLNSAVFRSFTAWNIVILIVDLIVLYLRSDLLFSLGLIVLNICIKYFKANKLVKYNRWFYFFTFIFFSILEIFLMEELCKSENFQSIFFKIILLTIIVAIQHIILVNEKKLIKFCLDMHLKVDVIALILLYISTIFTPIDKMEKLNVWYLLVHLIIFLIHYTLKNYKLTKKFNKDNNVEEKFRFESTLYNCNKELNNKADNKNEEKEYYSYFFSDLFSFVLLSAFFDNTLSFKWDNPEDIILIIIMFYTYFTGGLLIFNVAKVLRDNLKSLINFSFVSLLTLFLVIQLILKDVSDSKTNNIQIVSISVLTWLSPKIVPTVIDNMLIQTNYWKNKIIKFSDKTKATISIINITVYSILLILNITLEKIDLKNGNNIIPVVAISMAVGIFCAILLILVFTSFFNIFKSFYYKFEIEDSRLKKELPVVIGKKPESPLLKILMILCANIISILICIVYILFIYYFEGVDKQSAIEITKWSLPVVVPLVLKDLPIYLSYNENKTKIRPTIKFEFFRKMIEMNSLLTVMVFVVIRYFNLSNLNIISCGIWIILGIHLFSSSILLLLIPNLVEKQKNNVNQII